MATPHISCEASDFAKTVLMPGDPLRSRFIAENFLTDATLVNDVRGIQGYTGYYNGKRVSVMASGMGQPSIGLYSYELYHFFGVESIIRIGSCGSMVADLVPGDILIAMGACTNSNFAAQYSLPGTFCPIADFGLVRKAADTCDTLGFRYRVGNVFSSDVYYSDAKDDMEWVKMGVLGVEMEAAALYCNAARAGKKALAICTVSNSFITGVEMTPAMRQTGFSDMMRVALEIAE